MIGDGYTYALDERQPDPGQFKFWIRTREHHVSGRVIDVPRSVSPEEALRVIRQRLTLRHSPHVQWDELKKGGTR